MRFAVFALAAMAFAVFFAIGIARAEEGKDAPPSSSPALKTAMFAGGCFWCMEHSFDELDGVADVKSGYAGGHVVNPTYQQVSEGNTGHREVVQITYNPAMIGYDRLLEVYWRNIDPFDAEGQFCDKGEQYTSAIFATGDEERAIAEKSKAAMEQRFGRKVATAIMPAATFYPAEDYHQNYYLKNPSTYKSYRGSCGRDRNLHDIWGAEAGKPLQCITDR